ncbi:MULTISPECIES: bifunctional DNA-formamidopyrimidine glycosylase/DNA-(apurinic or apyrimidinic site) lyase [unclassified Oceanobacter]|uniref:bifunctional DNA-formamidopyrimidine glycosylase/DNA-(apurinic or apyrimidinic site) lyase n=1 Tax=unclassified Oceanobacter TaxID=2620260 RepID=UPI0026E43A72|nr:MULTISPECIES: bifunctional DNA-formamidopyrimidine glycosylase/DNA-(apurinic or apyrimidinic site) lyase [unclassified Oceanobacter]MDO6682040.1 bifunctional DNA-formamidopyrimidine glycosylase/DNA-(apurinic or apyrimidinic site) lyase [Oceanobacter sp. 5_MG-2023]MDP2505565.1 bifunctional DNA-formamidopyrimidine glycosylase/DNA-(apurinic or apyrimidinic site) lyase [Oceanobacter sp. 3_MG-2023]MDP2609764.1 bifunctional DNA-formamidopyrimidine glycosylase/DNA-(apurinic or apyrimidinic site) lya
MPELPEVETTLRGITPYLLNQTIENVVVRQSRLRWPVADEISALTGQQVTGLSRRGKYLLLQFDAGTAVWHLGMSGSLRLVKAEEDPRIHDHIDWVLGNGWILRYHDPRRFGALLWQAPDTVLSQIASLGPEPLLPEAESGLSAASLYQRSRGKKQAIKLFIMDNHTMVGVGNIYANESLFMAGIRPTTAAGNISKPRFERLLDCIRQVLGQAIEQGGTTLRDFVNSDGNPGYFAQQLQVYGRGGKPCRVCETTLKEIRQGQRATVYCPLCQRR